MLARIVFRYGTSAQWVDANPVLAAGEPGFDTTTGSLKVGDGVKTWDQLDYQTTDPAELDAILTAVLAAQAAAEQAAQDAEDAAASATGATDAGVFSIISNITPPDNTTRTLLDSLYAALVHDHAAADVTDLSDAIETAVGTLLIEGANITITPTGGGFEIAATGTGDPGLNTEQLMDYLGGVTTPAEGLKGTGLIAVTYDDGAGTLTITTTATENSPDSELLDRANATGQGDESLRVWGNDWMVAGNPSALQTGRVAYWNGTSWEHGTLDLSRFPTKDTTGGGLNGSIRQFADIPDTPLAEDETWVGDGALGHEAAPLGHIIAAFDASTGRLLDAALPLHQPRIVLVDAGQPVPPGTPQPYLLARKQTTASITPVLVDEGFVQADDQLVIDYGEGFAVGDYVILVIGATNEAVTPVVFGIDTTPGTGAITGWTRRVNATGGATALCEIWEGRVTTPIPSSTGLTISTFENDGTTPQNRVHLFAALLKGQNLAAASAFDLAAQTGQAGSDTTLTKTLNTGSSQTAQGDELGVLAFMNNSSLDPTNRQPNAVAPWSQMSLQRSQAGSGRSLLVAYRVLNAVGTVSADVAINGVADGGDGNSGGYAMGFMTMKAA